MTRIPAIALFTLILFLAATTAQAGQRMSVSASIDHACKMKRGTLVVPAGKNATNFQTTLSSGWIPCGGVSTPTRIGVRIPGFFYRVQYYKGKTETLQGNLATLTLGPGTYTVEVPDGGKNTRATVSYELKDGGKPTPPADTGIRMDDLSGEWSDPTVGSKARITQTGNSISITNTFMWQGKPVTWTGSGTVSGSRVTFNYHYTQNCPEKWENGTMNLVLKGQGMLSGSWTTKPSGYTQKITFMQKKSDKKKKAAATTTPAPKPAAKPVQKKPAARPAVQQTNPCPPDRIWRGGDDCSMPRHRLEREDR